MIEEKDPRPSITSFFGITGDEFDPDECTRSMGISPSEIEIKGQARLGGRLPVRVTHWAVKIEKRRSDSIEEPLAELLAMLWPQRSKIVAYISSHPVSATFGTNVTIYDERPEYCLSPETLKRLAYFKVDYCLDIFDYSE